MKKRSLAMALTAIMTVGSLTGMTANGEVLATIGPEAEAGAGTETETDTDTASMESAEAETEIGFAPQIENTSESNENWKENLDKIAQAYAQKVEDAPNLNWGDDLLESENFGYALVQMGENSYPQLVITSEQPMGMYAVHFADYDMETGEVVDLSYDNCVIGEEATTGAQANINPNPAGAGLLYTCWLPSTQEAMVRTLIVENHEIAVASEWRGTYRAADMPELSVEDPHTTWYNWTDPTGTAQISDGKWDGIRIDMTISPEEPAASAGIAGGGDAVSGDAVNNVDSHYKDIIEHAAEQDFGDQFDPIGHYQYALVSMRDSEHKQLLLSSDQSNGLSDIKFYDVRESDGELVSAADIYQIGVAGAGGFRGGLGQMKNRSSLRWMVVSAGTGAMTDTQLSLDDNGEVREEVEWEGTLGDTDAPSADEIEEIIWYECSDLTGLGMAGGEAEAAAAADTAAASDASAATENAEEDPAYMEWRSEQLLAGRQVVTGTLRDVTYDECLQIQGEPDPYPESSYRPDMTLFILETPTDMTVKNVDGEFLLKTVSLIHVMNETDAVIKGPRLAVSVSRETLYWPSDVSLPLGEPSTSDVEFFVCGE